MTKYIAVLTVAALFLLGCADHAGINSPEGSTGAMQSFTGTLNSVPTGSTVLAIDEMVTDEKSGARYSVSGRIVCEFFKDAEEYTFTANASLTVSSEPDGKEYTGTISANVVTKGPASGDIQFAQSYKLPNLPPGSFLSVEYRIVSEPVVEGLSIRVGRNQADIEAE